MKRDTSGRRGGSRAALLAVGFGVAFTAIPVQAQRLEDVSLDGTERAPSHASVGAPANGEWRLPAGDFQGTRYSPLDQITRANVRNLKVAWTFSTGVNDGHEGQPLVVDNTMYVITPYPTKLYALDLTKPGAPMKWTYAPKVNPASQGDSIVQSGTDAVYRFGPDGTPTAIAKGAELHGPNGIVATPDGLLIASFNGNEVYRLDASGNRTPVAQLPHGQLDGLVRLADGTLLVTSWAGKAVYRVDAGGNATAVVENVTSPASIGYDSRRNRVIVPLVQENQVRIESLAPLR